MIQKRLNYYIAFGYINKDISLEKGHVDWIDTVLLAFMKNMAEIFKVITGALMKPLLRYLIRSLLFVILLTVTCHLSLVTIVTAAGPGTSSAAFLKLGFGARPLAMGESYVAFADDVSALHYNPAGLAFSNNLRGQEAYNFSGAPYEMLFSHALHIQDIKMSQFGVMKRPFGMSMTYLSVGDIEGRTAETPEPENTFTASDFALGASYGRMIPDTGIGIGVTARFIRQVIGNNSAQAVSGDFGALYRFNSYPVSIGVSVCHLGTKMKFIDEGYPLPRIVRLGMATGIGKSFPANISIQADFSRDSDVVYRVGMEYLGFGPFALRPGYTTTLSSQRKAVLGTELGSTSSGISELYGLFMGVGFRVRTLNIDYALMPYGELGNAHRFSVGMKF